MVRVNGWCSVVKNPNPLLQAWEVIALQDPRPEELPRLAPLAGAKTSLSTSHDSNARARRTFRDALHRAHPQFKLSTPTPTPTPAIAPLRFLRWDTGDRGDFNLLFFLEFFSGFHLGG